MNETLARILWPGENPIGKRFACCEDNGPKGRITPVWHEVVGVVGDVRVRGLDVDVQPTFYLPLAQMPPGARDWLGRTMDLVVRTRAGSFPANELRTIVASIAPGVPIYQLSTVEEKIAGALAESHFDTFLLSLFAGIALVFLRLEFAESCRMCFRSVRVTSGCAWRWALRGDRSRVMYSVVGYGSSRRELRSDSPAPWLALAWFRHLLYGVRPTDALTFVLAPSVLAAVALMASYIPARRAMRLDPLVALRCE